MPCGLPAQDFIDKHSLKVDLPKVENEHFGFKCSFSPFFIVENRQKGEMLTSSQNCEPCAPIYTIDVSRCS